MSVPITTADRILRARLGEPGKEVKYVLGFTTATGSQELAELIQGRDKWRNNIATELNQIIGVIK